MRGNAMDKRIKHRTNEQDLALRDELHQALADNTLDLAEAVRRMQRISRLTQPEFAQHRGISTAALRKIMSGKGNPTVDTINKVVSIFGLEVGLVPKRPARR
jgi:DNA-binding phage protein